MKSHSYNGNVSGNVGYQGYVPMWQKDYFPIKIGSHVSSSDRLKKFPKHETTKEPPKLQKRGTVYENDFVSKPCHTVRAKNPDIIYSNRDFEKLNCDETFKTMYKESYSSKDHTNVRGKNLRKRSKEWSINRVNPINEQGVKGSSYSQDFSNQRISASFDLDGSNSTKDINKGTNKDSIYCSSYMGHIPAHLPTKKTKNHDEVDVYRLQQRSSYYTKANPNVPGYSGYIPHSISNYKDDPFVIDRRTLKETDYGPKEVDPKVTSKHGLKHYTLKEFFAIPANGSQDGLTHAHKFYKNFRPYEGMPKI